MERIKQLAAAVIAIRRFDTGESVTFEQDVEMDLDDDTAAYLKSLRVKDQDGNDLANFVAV